MVQVSKILISSARLFIFYEVVIADELIDKAIKIFYYFIFKTVIKCHAINIVHQINSQRRIAQLDYIANRSKIFFLQI